MRKLFAALLIWGLMAGLMLNTTLEAKEKKAKYQVAVKLEKVERKPDADPSGTIQNGQVYISGPIAVAWSPVPQGFRFRVYNKSTGLVTILWNECSFIDEKGGSHNITHKGVKRPDLSEMKTMKPQVIQPGANWQDVLFPFDSDYIIHEKELTGFSKGNTVEDNTKYGKAGLRIKPIFAHQYTEKQVKKLAKKFKKKNKGKEFDLPAYINQQTFTVAVALKIGDKQYNYHFFFRSHLLEK